MKKIAREEWDNAMPVALFATREKGDALVALFFAEEGEVWSEAPNFAYTNEEVGWHLFVRSPYGNSTTLRVGLDDADTITAMETFNTAVKAVIG